MSQTIAKQWAEHWSKRGPECPEKTVAKEYLDSKTREGMLSRQCGELAAALRQCEQQLVLVSHLWRGADHFEHAQLCSDIAYQARLVLQKWEEL